MVRQAAASTEIRGGLRLSGRVLARSTRVYANSDGSQSSCVTYRILGGIDMFFVDEWVEETKAMPIGIEVEDLPVYVKAFSGKDGKAQSRLVVQRNSEA